MPSPEKFQSTLADFAVDEAVVTSINEGFSGLASKSPKKVKAAYFSRALAVMEEQLGPETTRRIFEANACCKSGARLTASKAFARVNGGLPLAEKLGKIAAAPQMNMGAPRLDGDGSLVIEAVRHVVDGRYACACPSISGQARPGVVSKDYCYCCAGHFKFHYEIMLGVKLETSEIVSSPLADDRFPCTLRYTVAGS